MKEPVHFKAADGRVLNTYQGGELRVSFEYRHLVPLIHEATKILILGELAADENDTPPASLADLIRRAQQLELSEHTPITAHIFNVMLNELEGG